MGKYGFVGKFTWVNGEVFAHYENKRSKAYNTKCLHKAERSIFERTYEHQALGLCLGTSVINAGEIKTAGYDCNGESYDSHLDISKTLSIIKVMLLNGKRFAKPICCLESQLTLLLPEELERLIS